jgi:hypothetical protein
MNWLLGKMVQFTVTGECHSGEHLRIANIKQNNMGGWLTDCHCHYWSSQYKNVTRIRCWWLMPINIATWEDEIGRIMVPDQPDQKSLQEPISVGKSWAWWCVHVILVMVGSIK